RVPDASGAVATARGETPAVRAPLEADDRAVMRAPHALTASRRIPDPDGMILARGRYPASIRAPGHIRDPRVVAHAGHSLPRRQVPQDDRFALVPCRHKPLPVGAPRNGEDRPAVGQAEALLPSIRLHHQDLTAPGARGEKPRVPTQRNGLNAVALRHVEDLAAALTVPQADRVLAAGPAGRSNQPAA